LLVGLGGGHDQGAAFTGQFGARRQTFVAVGPQVDEHLAAQALGLDDPPDLERGALVGAHD
jgi:hypothetical protein